MIRPIDKRGNKKQQGFTLIELLVTISIIGLLSSIILASVVSAREAARDMAIISSVRSLHSWMMDYYFDHGIFPEPDTCLSGVSCKICTSPEHSSWDWPPAGVTDIPFESGIPYLRGPQSCLVLTAVNSDPEQQYEYVGYELRFFLYYGGIGNLQVKNQILRSIFNYSDERDPPCEEYEDNIAVCTILYEQ